VSRVSPRGTAKESRSRLEPLRDFLRRAAARAADEMGRDSGVYRSPAWHFARCLKARPEFEGLTAEEATMRVDAEVEAMFPGVPVPWVELGLPDQDSEDAVIDPRTDFLSCWDKVTKPLHLGGAVDAAAEQADEKPVNLGDRFAHPADEPFRRLISICYYLGASSPERFFFLSCRDAGRVLGVSATAAMKLLDRAKNVGMLEAEHYTGQDKKKRKARTWRYVGPAP
jgi:hypothetical protein